jgi:hypothetical protein
MTERMNDRQRAQLTTYVEEASNFTETWQIHRWIKRVTTFLTEAVGPDETDRFKHLGFLNDNYDEFAMKLRAGSANSDRGLSGGSVLWQPKMAEKRRTDEQTSTQEPFGDVQGQGGFGGDPGREDFGRTGRAV